MLQNSIHLNHQRKSGVWDLVRGLRRLYRRASIAACSFASQSLVARPSCQRSGAADLLLKGAEIETRTNLLDDGTGRNAERKKNKWRTRESVLVAFPLSVDITNCTYISTTVHLSLSTFLGRCPVPASKQDGTRCPSPKPRKEARRANQQTDRTEVAPKPNLASPQGAPRDTHASTSGALSQIQAEEPTHRSTS